MPAWKMLEETMVCAIPLKNPGCGLDSWWPEEFIVADLAFAKAFL